MLRYADRITFIGAGVIVLSLLAVNLLPKQDRRSDDRTNMMSRDRGAVVRGSVREEAPEPAKAPVVAVADARPETATATATAAEITRDEPAPRPVAQTEPARVHRAQKRTLETRKTAREKHRGNHAVAQTRVAPLEAAAVRAPVPPVQRAPLESAAANTLDKPARAPATDAPMPVAAKPSAVANATPAYVVSIQAPKTRAEVQDELRRARMNGNLPRFGNPDPYGPGGTPSATAP
ncbi:hypothetical protein [Caballeronia sp. GACF4]|uniref:hypothetical protein n=1 Tax=Caballeronia sp. GACF4 TaxID=2921763 RepID=UPI002029131E|nr:hypothetical protein [Caballeronia sp. GACF4]